MVTLRSSAQESIPEFTLKAVVAGVLLGLLFGAANAYLGLRVGLTITSSIPAAVMTVVAFRALRMRSTILEANLSQTIGSASSSLASGAIFTIPALFMWGIVPPYLQIVALCFLGGVLGLAAMIPLRRLLVVEAHAELPYPEGTACAEVLKASESGTSHGAWIFRGMAIGAGVKLALALGHLVPDDVATLLPVLPKAELALEISPALLAVGYILGFRQASVCAAGSVVSALVLTPIIAWFGARLGAPVFPETAKLVADMSVAEIWSKYVRYVGAGAVATAGLLTVAFSLPKMAAAISAVVRGVRGARGRELSAAAPVVLETDRDLPGGFILGAIACVVAVAALVPGVFGGGLDPGQRLICAGGVALFGLLFVTVAARIVGIVGVSTQPTSGITLVTLLGVASVFASQGWTQPGARAAVLTVGTLVAIAASKAGDISQDLKTGFLVGATPAKQQLGQLIGAAFACWAVAGTVLLLGRTYEFGSTEIPAPQATLMKTIIEGVLSGQLPWDLVATGAGLSVAAMMCGVSGLAFAIGVYLPLASMLALFVGGLIRRLAERGRPAAAGAAAPATPATPAVKGAESDAGVLAASGLVAGEGLAGIVVAFLAFNDWVPKAAAPRLGGIPGEIASLALVVAVGIFLTAARRRSAASPVSS